MIQNVIIIVSYVNHRMHVLNAIKITLDWNYLIVNVQKDIMTFNNPNVKVKLYKY